ncbi:hypothetical protein KIN20_010912 [Parelaphostrongylus tenuis]|uniref:Uncharacterized protein n=1 Tax=Parelaphostrongylus tenuis TaxID=148309 RepID=A0AAD5MUN9_PARTN|nr:hypothetical protein KIN20_010912 [Parelaphostrongylus tenuis]
MSPMSCNTCSCNLLRSPGQHQYVKTVMGTPTPKEKNYNQLVSSGSGNTDTSDYKQHKSEYENIIDERPMKVLSPRAISLFLTASSVQKNVVLTCKNAVDFYETCMTVV